MWAAILFGAVVVLLVLLHPDVVDALRRLRFRRALVGRVSPQQARELLEAFQQAADYGRLVDRTVLTVTLDADPDGRSFEGVITLPEGRSEAIITSVYIHSDPAMSSSTRSGSSTTSPGPGWQVVWKTLSRKQHLGVVEDFGDLPGKTFEPPDELYVPAREPTRLVVLVPDDGGPARGRVVAHLQGWVFGGVQGRVFGTQELQ